jgi:hypothetical protein
MRSRWPQCLCPAARLLRVRSYHGTAGCARAVPLAPAAAPLAVADVALADLAPVDAAVLLAEAVRDALGVDVAEAGLAADTSGFDAARASDLDAALASGCDAALAGGLDAALAAGFSRTAALAEP